MHISYILSYKKKLVLTLLAPPIVAYASIVLRGGVDVKRETRLLLFQTFTKISPASTYIHKSLPLSTRHFLPGYFLIPLQVYFFLINHDLFSAISVHMPANMFARQFYIIIVLCICTVCKIFSKLCNQVCGHRIGLCFFI